MKRLLLALLVATLSITASAQFILVPDSLTSKNKKGYIVVKYDGQKAELFQKVKLRLLTKKSQPIVNISYSEPEIIAISGTFSNLFIEHGSVNDMLSPVINFKMYVYFKDNRIRFDVPTITGPILDGFDPKFSYSLSPRGNDRIKNCFNIFKSNGEVRYENIKSIIEKRFNDFIVDIISELDTDKIPRNW